MMEKCLPPPRARARSAAGAEHGTACLYRPTLADVAARVVAPRVKAAGGGCATLVAVLDREAGGDTAPVGT